MNSPKEQKGITRGRKTFEKTKEPSLLQPDTLVTFIVGEDATQQTFKVHKSFAIVHSPFFDAAFNGTFKEGDTQTMRMSDVDGEVFGLLVHWLYFQKIDASEYNPVISDIIMPLVKLWVLADRCLIPRLQSSVRLNINVLARGGRFDATQHHKIRELASYAYKSGKPQLKRLVIDLMGGSVDSFRQFCADLPTDMLLDLTVSLKKHAPRFQNPGLLVCRVWALVTGEFVDEYLIFTMREAWERNRDICCSVADTLAANFFGRNLHG